MTEVQQEEMKFRKQVHLSHNFEAAGDFLLNIRSHKDLPVSSDVPDVHYIRMSSAFSASYGFLLIYFFILDSRYSLVNHFSFLLVSLLHLVIEIVKCMSSSCTNQNFILTFGNFCNFVASFVMLIIYTYIISILFGADLTENIGATLIFSCHISSFILIPLYFHAGERFVSVIMFEGKLKTPIESCDLIICAGVLAGAWFGAFVIPLDWDRDWQRWPIPCVIGSIFGFTGSHIFLLVCTIFKNSFSTVFTISKIKYCSM